MGISSLSLIYNISATVEDCKRFDIAWSRAHDRFFCADVFLLILITPVAIAGASLWQVVLVLPGTLRSCSIRACSPATEFEIATRTWRMRRTTAARVSQRSVAPSCFCG